MAKKLSMRARFIPLVLLLTAAMLAAALKEESLQELISRAESARPEDRPSLYVDIMEHQLKDAEHLYHEGKVDEARSAISDIVTYSDKAHDTAIAAPKKIKNTEIALRKIAAKLRDLRRTLNFEDQGPVQAASEHLEQLRTDLLNHMFAKN